MDRWYTKEDVMKDLAMANGLGANFDDDDSFIIRGARAPPPPRHLIDEDDEMENYVRYGIYGGRDHHSPHQKPDLKGISEMIRMVNDSLKDNSQEENPEETSIVISKLNPFVPEFVPKQAMNCNNKSDSSTNETNANAKNASKKSKKRRKEEKDPPQELNICKKEEVLKENFAETHKDINLNDSLKPTASGEKCLEMKRGSCDQNDDDKQSEKSKLEAILKEKIIGTAKAKTVKEKSARNVAIAALLKLKSGPPQSPLTTSSSESKTPKSDSPAPTNTNGDSPKETLILHPPDFYESKFTNAQANNVFSPPHITVADNSSNEKDHHKESERAITSNLESAERAVTLVSPEERESIQKVKNWLNQSGKPRTLEPPQLEPINFKKRDPAPHTGPIVYKKKETKESPKSPVSDAASKKPSLPGAFVPSQYADDLAKKYEERVKANEERELDMWSKLERDLKAKDELLKERLKAQNGSNPNSSPGSSRCPSSRQ